MKILFLCTGNSCRSRMAEGWAKKLKAKEFEAHSAGTVEAMLEAGVDISGQRSKHVNEVLDEGFDWVVTLCGGARETCPVFPGAAQVVHRGFEDPPKLSANAASREEAMAHYRRVRDEIRAFIESLPESLEQLEKETVSFKLGRPDVERPGS